MALGDWTQVLSGIGAPALDISTPMVGNGSLRMPAMSGGGGSQRVLMYLTSLDKGFTKGRIRTLLRVDTRPSTGNTGVNAAGPVCMLSALADTANCYILGLGRYNGGSPSGAGDQYFFIAKMTSFVTESIVGSAVQIETSLVDGDYFPVQLEWNVDVPNLGGVRLTGSKGTKNSTDFGTLATFADVIDTSSPLTTSVGEGIYAYRRVSGTSMRFSFDQTSIYQLS